MQRLASLEDQERSCRNAAAAKGWVVLDNHIYTDKARSGTRVAGQDGLNALLEAAKSKPRPFDRLIIDDTSRLARDVTDVLVIVRQLRACSVAIYFVAQNMDSRDEQTFDLMLSIFGAFDQQQVTRLRKRVKLSLEGRFLNGYNAGSVAYGYESVKEKSTDAGAVGHGAFNGSRLVVIESEAIVIRRIFQWFADGTGYYKISKMLNIEGVHWPHAPHGKWSPTAVKTILRNEKYRGVNSFGLTKQSKDSLTGKSRKEEPDAKPLRREDESIRIVSNELWNRAAEWLRLMAEKQNARRQGGYNRAVNGVYPYSGLLICGVCGRSMNMGGRKGKGVYECVNHRHRAGCTNSLRIREDVVSGQITEALSKQLLVPETLAYLASSVFRELKEVLEERKKSLKPEHIERLEAARAECSKKIDRLIEAIEDTGPESLRHRLAAQEFERDRIIAELRTARAAQNAAITEEGLHALLVRNVKNLLEVLKADPDLARAVLHKQLKRLMLYPDVSEGRAVYHVVGEMDLFTSAGDHPDSSDDGALLECFGTARLSINNEENRSQAETPGDASGNGFERRHPP